MWCTRFSAAKPITSQYRFLSIDFSHEKPAPHQLEHVQNRLIETLPLMFRQRMDYTFYRKDVFCDDRIFNVQKRGIDQLMSHFGMIGTCCQNPHLIIVLEIQRTIFKTMHPEDKSIPEGFPVLLPHVEMEVISAIPVIEEDTVRCRWRVKYVSFPRLLLNPRLFRFDYRAKNLSWFDGYSVLTVDGNGEVHKVTLQKMMQEESKLLMPTTAEKMKEQIKEKLAI